MYTMFKRKGEIRMYEELLVGSLGAKAVGMLDDDEDVCQDCNCLKEECLCLNIDEVMDNIDPTDEVKK